MGFAELLTIVLIVLKLLGLAKISWLLVFAPVLIVYSLLGLGFIALTALAIVAGGKK